MHNSGCAIVTGAARGLGREISLTLASDGHPIALFDLDEAGLEETKSLIVGAGGVAEAFRVDVSVDADVTAGVEAAAASLGAPTILVNNAGVIRDNYLFKAELADWDLVMGVHLRGAFLMSREVQRFMVENKWGRIVNISSVSALGNAGQTNYAAAKAGIQGFTKTLALELGRFGITANSVAPGFIETEMTRVTAERLGMTFSDFLDSVAKDIAVRRAGQPADVANAVSFFVSPNSGFVNGQVLYVSGGPNV